MASPAYLSQSSKDLTPSQRSQAYWLAEVKRAERHFEKWIERGNKLLRLYRKQRDAESTTRQYSMLWANTEVLKPSIYARAPKPQVSRRFRDRDPIGRTASELLERAATYECERMNLDAKLRNVRDDVLLPGRGICWARYEADIEEVDDPGEDVSDTPNTEEYPPPAVPSISGQRTCIDYVPWRQFLHGPARTWDEVPWVAKISYMSEEAGKKRFGDRWKDVALDHGATSKENGFQDEQAVEKGLKSKATVYEIWCKRTQKVHFIAKSAPDVLEEGPPPLNFDGFWPCPPPVYATITTDSLIPIPDYAYYLDQAEEINDLTNRIAALQDGLKLVGFYPAGGPEDVSTAMEKALSPSTQNLMIPVSSWAAFSEKGGKGSIEWLPIVQVVEAIRACIELRNQLVQDVYQISGIGDVMRGATDPNETLGAQQLKSQYGSARIRDRQQEMARFSRDCIRLISEIIAEHFDPMRVMQMANMVPPPPPRPTAMLGHNGGPPMDSMAQMGAPPVPTPPGGVPPMQQPSSPLQMAGSMQPPPPDPAMIEHQKKVMELEAAFKLLKDEKLRGFRIDIETDSTIQPDEDAEKSRRVEFVTAVGGLMQQALPVIQVAPELSDMLGEILIFTVRGFRAGRTLEDAIEQGMEAMKKRLTQQQQAGPPPDPKAEAMKAQAQIAQQKAQADTQIQGQKLQMDGQKAQAELGLKQQTSQADMALKAQEAKANFGLQQFKVVSDLQLQQQKQNADIARGFQEAQARRAQADRAPTQ
jgi:hypothetical protein